MLKKISITLFILVIVASALRAQTYSDEFWDDPNVIWKINTGSIITSEFAKKLHVQGNYTIEERALRGGRKIITMVPSKEPLQIKKRINWNDPSLLVKDQNDVVLPLDVSQTLLRVNSIKWEIDTLDTGSIEMTLLTSANNTEWADQRVESVKEWVDKWRNQKLPNFSLMDIDGKLVDNEVGKDKILVMSFWNTKCGKCIGELEQLNKITEIFYDKDVVFLAPNFEMSGTIAMFLQENQFNYRVLCCSQPFVDEMQIQYYPTHIIVDKDGTILDISVGGTTNIGRKIGQKLSWLTND